MFSRVSAISLLLVTIFLQQNARAVGESDAESTVALTATVFADAGKSERELMEALLAVLESEVSMQSGLSVVERRQIDLALQELALSEDLGQNEVTRLQLGKIVSADLIVTLELQKPEVDDQTLRVLIRIVESLTGIVRGVAVAPVSDAALDEAVGQIAPDLSPSSLFVQGEHLLAATRVGVYEFDLEDRQWTKTMEGSGLGEVRIFPGKSHVWATKYGREIFPYAADEAEAARFQAAWFNERGQAGIRILFAIEHNGQVWYGGYPWARFRSVGFYRVNPETGEFRMYGLRDGFHMSTTYTTRAAVAVGNDLWLATSAGLARVTPRAQGVAQGKSRGNAGP
ncbi:MAG: hypothetical protein WD049_02315 [Candidatus Paceibacterota bacterium]